MVKNGDTIGDLLPHILGRVEQVQEVTLHELPPASKVQTQLRGVSGLDALVAYARTSCRESGFPFWDAVLMSVSEQDDALKLKLVEQACFYQDMKNVATKVTLKVKDLGISDLSERLNSVTHGRLLAMSPELLLDDGSVAHMPMLDFRLEPSEANLDLVELILHSLGMSGWVLESGRSTISTVISC